MYFILFGTTTVKIKFKKVKKH